MVKGSRSFHLQPFHERAIHIRHFQPGNGRNDFKSSFYDRQDTADQHAGQHAYAKSHGQANQNCSKVVVPCLEIDDTHDATQHHDKQPHKEARSQQLSTIPQVMGKQHGKHAGERAQNPELDLLFRSILLRQNEKSAKHADGNSGKHAQKRSQQHRDNQRSHHIGKVQKFIAYVGSNVSRYMPDETKKQELDQNRPPRDDKGFVFPAQGTGA